jgi:cysteine desulfurase
MGAGEEEARASVRVSVGWNTTHEDVDRFLGRFPDVVRQVRDGLERPGTQRTVSR